MTMQSDFFPIYLPPFALCRQCVSLSLHTNISVPDDDDDFINAAAIAIVAVVIERYKYLANDDGIKCNKVVCLRDTA